MTTLQSLRIQTGSRREVIMQSLHRLQVVGRYSSIKLSLQVIPQNPFSGSVNNPTALCIFAALSIYSILDLEIKPLIHRKPLG